MHSPNSYEVDSHLILAWRYPWALKGLSLKLTYEGYLILKSALTVAYISCFGFIALGRISLDFGSTQVFPSADIKRS